MSPTRDYFPYTQVNPNKSWCDIGANVDEVMENPPSRAP
jgi:hypothetical protein